MPAWSSLARHAPPVPPIPRPRLLRRATAPRDDARTVAEAWRAYACGAALGVLVRTIRGPERARVLWRGGSWVVTLHAGHEALTLGPLGLAVPGVAGREACVSLAEALVEGGLEHVEELVPEVEQVVARWRASASRA